MLLFRVFLEQASLALGLVLAHHGTFVLAVLVAYNHVAHLLLEFLLVYDLGLLQGREHALRLQFLDLTDLVQVELGDGHLLAGGEADFLGLGLVLRDLVIQEGGVFGVQEGEELGGLLDDFDELELAFLGEAELVLHALVHLVQFLVLLVEHVEFPGDALDVGLSVESLLLFFLLEQLDDGYLLLLALAPQLVTLLFLLLGEVLGELELVLGEVLLFLQLGEVLFEDLIG